MKSPHIASMSGLEYLTSVIEGREPTSPVLAFLGLTFAEAEEGRVVVEGAPSDQFLNPMETTHGGWFGTILDTALGCAIMSTLPRGSVYTTLEYKVNLICGIKPGQRMRATGTVDHVGRSTGVSHAELRGIEDGKLYATGSTTCLVIRPRD